MRGLVAATIGLVSATAGFALATPPAPAQVVAQEDADVARAREKLQQTQAEANAAHQRYQQAVDERDQVQGQIRELELAIPAMRAREAELRAQLSARAAALYKNTDPAAGLEALQADNPIQAGRKTKLTEVADAFDNERARQLNETAGRLQQAQVDLEGKQAQLDELVPRLELRNPPSPFWYGRDPGVATRNFNTVFAKGWAPTWQLMGHGNWATDPDYASKVIGIYRRMVESRNA